MYISTSNIGGKGLELKGAVNGSRIHEFMLEGRLVLAGFWGLFLSLKGARV